MSKQLDFNKTVYELAQEYPEIVDIMSSLGFTEIAKKPILNSVGKLMTIPKGAKMKGIEIDKVIAAMESDGFEITGYEPDEEPENSNTAKIKSYLRRLSNGESLDSVRADFVKNFSEVDPADIMEAEQQLIKEGTPINEVQKLCDIHSALFHGATREEKLAKAEKAVQEALDKRDSYPKADYSNKEERAEELEATVGHPLHMFMVENEALKKLIEETNAALESGEELDDKLAALRGISSHYAKKGDLVYPVLKVRYGISGPSDVMWTNDDEIRNELAALTKKTDRGDEWKDKLKSVLTRADEMIYKEQNILFPICAVNFTDDEWHGIYRDSKDYAECFGVSFEQWPEAENAAEAALPEHDGEIVLPGGHMTVQQLAALLNTIPGEITFVDDNNINRFFNEGPKVFKRPGMAIDREVFSCHPPKVEPMVRKIIESFRSGERDEVPVWMEKNGRTMLVRYMAVRDKNGNYVGTLEFIQDMEFAKKHFEKLK